MDDQSIRDALRRAEDLIGDTPSGLHEVAFQVILEALLRQHAGNVPALGPNAPEVTLDRAQSMTINELLAKCGASSHPERVVAIAFHSLRNGQGAVTRKDLEEAYGKARTKKPQNFADVIGQCVQRGHLIEDSPKDGMKSWVITPTGESFIGQLL